MKKIYSIVLMAAALLVGTNVKAVEVSTPEALKAAIEGATGDLTITLMADIELANLGDSAKYTSGKQKGQYKPQLSYMDSTTMQRVYSGRYTMTYNNDAYGGTAGVFAEINNGQNIILDLNNHNITSGEICKTMFQITKGHVTVKGNGTIWNKSKEGAYVSIPWLNAAGEKVIKSYKSGKPVYWTETIAVSPKGYVFLLIGKGDKEVNGNWWSWVTIGSGVQVIGQASAATIDHDPVEKNHRAYGAYIQLLENAYVSGGKYGLQISGNVQKPADSDLDFAYLPKIDVAASAEVTNNDVQAVYASGVYVGGFGNAEINGNVHGATGVYAKSGNIAIGDGAVVKSDATTYMEAAGRGSGTAATGSAIVMDSNASYAGNMTVSVSGNAQITGAAGYAIESTVTTADNNEVKGVEISGGTFTSDPAGQGCMNIAPVIADAAANIKIDGANFDAKDEIEAVLTAIGQESFLGQTTDEAGNTIYVVTTNTTGEKLADNENVAIDGNKKAVLWTGNQTGDAVDGAELTYLELRDNSHLTIPANVTLKVGSIVMTANTKITVKGKGKLIITGEDGLMANQKTNLEIEANKGAMAMFMLTPKAKANTNPSATVRLETTSYWNGSDYKYERMGVPAIDGMTLNDINKVGSAGTLYAIYWNANTQKWVQHTVTEVMKPFDGVGLLSQSTAAGSKYDFPCRLLGSSDVNLSLINQWNFFANSYMAELDLKEFAAAIKAAGEGVAAGVYVDLNGGNNDEDWEVVSLTDLTQPGSNPVATKLNPMEGFILNNQTTSTANAAINYENMIWDPVFDPNHQAIAARRSNSNDLTRVKITVTNENGRRDIVTLRQSDEYSAEYDNGADFEKYMGINAVDFFATTELGNLAQVASDNIDGLRLSVGAKEAGSMKMTFSNITGEELVIRDNLTGATMTMTEDAEYFFSVGEGAATERFQIIGVNKTPTDVENVVEATGAKAVYTVLGQYIGTTDNWNILPAGIYVVDGVKMVK